MVAEKKAPFLAKRELVRVSRLIRRNKVLQHCTSGQYDGVDGSLTDLRNG